MLLGLEWYWWVVIVLLVIVLLPLKIKFMKWWGQRRSNPENHKGKWGG